MSDPDSYYLLQDGGQTGPFTLPALQSMVETGAIQDSALVWKDGLPEWVSLASVLPEPILPPTPAPAEAIDPRTDPTFSSFVADAFSYPFRGDGLLILMLGTIVFTVLDFLGRFSFLLNAVAWGYLLLMLQQVIHATAMGDNRLPNWPDFDGFGELFTKAIQWAVEVVVSFGPAIFLGFTAAREESTGLAIGCLGVGLLGGIYFPMAILSVGMHDSVGGLNPVGVFAGIIRVPGHYVLTLLIFFSLIGVQVLTGKLSAMIPIAGLLIDKLDELWSAVFLSRILGGLYYVNRRRLSWFGE